MHHGQHRRTGKRKRNAQLGVKESLRGPRENIDDPIKGEACVKVCNMPVVGEAPLQGPRTACSLIEGALRCRIIYIGLSC